MRSILCAAALAAALPGQDVEGLLPGRDVEWLRPVARFAVPQEIVVAADLAADGSLLVTLSKERLVRVHSLSPFRRLRQFELPDGVDAEGARLAADDATLVVPGTTGRPTLALSLADGRPVTPVPEVRAGRPQMPAGAGEPGPAMRNLRVTRDGRFATWRCEDRFWLWSNVAGPRDLDTSTVDARLTGDGRFVVLTQTDGVVVVPATGGDAWAVPDLGLGLEPVAVPFGGASRFVAIDRACVAVVDAGAQKVESRMPLAKLGFTDGSASALAARPDGKQLVVRWRSPEQGAPTGWRLDLEAPGAQRLPSAAFVADWIHDGFMLLGGQPGPCNSLHGAEWTWLAGRDAGPLDALPTLPAQVMTIPSGRLAAVPGRREFVFACETREQRLVRIEASTGKVLATQPPPKHSRRDQFVLESISSVLVLGGCLLDTSNVFDADWSPHTRLELRRLDDLSLIASTPLMCDILAGETRVTAAEHAPRLLLWFSDQLAVYDFVSPADAKK